VLVSDRWLRVFPMLVIMASLWLLFPSLRRSQAAHGVRGSNRAGDNGSFHKLSQVGDRGSDL